MRLTQREKRALSALINRPVMREHLDLIVGCSNGPDLLIGTAILLLCRCWSQKHEES